MARPLDPKAKITPARLIEAFNDLCQSHNDLCLAHDDLVLQFQESQVLIESLMDAVFESVSEYNN